MTYAVISSPDSNSSTDARPARKDVPLSRIGNSIAWPLAILLMAHRFFFLAINGDITDDFTTVYSALRRFIEGVPVYNEIYHFVDPHYLYSPGATLVLSPLGFITHFTLARWAFIAANLLAIVIALGMLTRMSGFKLRSVIFPASLAFAMLTETVQSTLIFSNINGVLLLMLVIFLWCVINDKPWVGGVIIGLAILIKPMFLPLLFLPLVKKQWPMLIGGLCVPVLFNLIGWFVVPGASDYVTRTMPYLGETRDFANSSLPGLAAYFGMPAGFELLWFAVFGTFVALGVLGLLRFRNTEAFFWATTTSGLLLTGVFLLSSLGQMYYSMMVFPMIFSVLGHRSVFHSWLAWVAAYLFLTPDTFSSSRWPDLARMVEFFRATAGWGLLIVITGVAAVIWFIRDLRETKDRTTGAPAVITSAAEADTTKGLNDD